MVRLAARGKARGRPPVNSSSILSHAAPTQRLQQCPLDDVSAYDTVWCTLFTNSAPCVLTLDAPLHAAHFAKKRCLHLTRLCMVRALPKKELTHSKCTRCAPLNTQLRYHISESSRPFCSCGGHGYLFFCVAVQFVVVLLRSSPLGSRLANRGGGSGTSS